LTCLGSTYKVVPFVVGWLLLGEISSLPLNMRWLLISTGRGASSAMFVTNVVFAITFFLTRVVIFWAGLWHVVVHMRPMVIDSCSPLVINTICGFVAGGACLNAMWMTQIVKMALRGGKKAN
jgi:hypothetical protein